MSPHPSPPYAADLGKVDEVSRYPASRTCTKRTILLLNNLAIERKASIIAGSHHLPRPIEKDAPALLLE